MQSQRPRYIHGLIAALLCLASAAPAPAEQPGERTDVHSIEEAMEPVNRESFADLFPQGKQSVVERQLAGTAATLRAAHKAALRGKEERPRYRRALVFQAAARRALAARDFPLALYLTLHGRSLAEHVVHANSSEWPPRDRSYDLELIKRAGGVDSQQIDALLEQTTEFVPPVELLFVDDE